MSLNIKNEKGYTLLEILIVMSILSIILISMFEVLNSNYMTMNKEIKNQSARDSLRVFITYMTNDLFYSENVDVQNQSNYDILLYQDYKGEQKIIKFAHNKGIYEIKAGEEKLIATARKFDTAKPMVQNVNGMIIFNVYAKDVNVLLDLAVRPRVSD